MSEERFIAIGGNRLHVSIDSDAGGGMRTVSQATPRDAVVEVREGDEGKDLDVTLPERLFDE